MAQVQVKRKDTGVTLQTFTGATPLQDAIDFISSQGDSDYITSKGGLGLETSGAMDNVVIGASSKWTAVTTADAIVDIYPAVWHDGNHANTTQGSYFTTSDNTAIYIKRSVGFIRIRGHRFVLTGGSSTVDCGINPDIGWMAYDVTGIDGKETSLWIERNLFTYADGVNHVFSAQTGSLNGAVEATFNIYATANDTAALSSGSVAFLYGYGWRSKATGTGNITLNVFHNQNTVRTNFPVNTTSYGCYLRADAYQAGSTATVNFTANNSVCTFEATCNRDADSKAWQTIYGDSTGTIAINCVAGSNNADDDNSLSEMVFTSGSLSGSIANITPANEFTSFSDHHLLPGGSLASSGAASGVTNDIVLESFKTPPSIGAFEFVSASGGAGAMGLEMDLLL